MTDVITLINAKDYKALAQYCEFEEIQSASGSNIMLGQLYPVYLASCILLNDLQSARHVRKRILASNNKTPEIDAIWSVATALIQKSYPQVYQNLDSFQWSEYMVPLVQQIKADIREQMLIMIPNVYTSIELKQVRDYFGTSEEECLQGR
ncbi:hypothetical protein INT47_008346 [Mucor saturninus]|uniref:CSN8/PSMD8/EIF3K domain-containing protein n=1 Tax=Mucor saturninus TaxID=64648 RepID=A0A8H7RFY1_9FUNG|nr:hypothetical protein INT47_008346 [Mucor saturninus]